MKIYVCVKHTVDSAAIVRVVGRNRIDERVPYSINPYDLHAVEAAVQLAATTEGAEVVAVTVGTSDAAVTLERALAMGAERGLHVRVEEPPDSILTARVLAAAIRTDGEPDLVFTGKASIDSQGSQVPFRLAACLGIEAASGVAALEYEPGALVVECEGEGGGRRVLRVPLPCVIGVGKALNKPRHPTLQQLLRARRKPVTTVDRERLEIEAPRAGTEVLELRPAVAERRKRILEGDPEEMVAELVRRLREEARAI